MKQGKEKVSAEEKRRGLMDQKLLSELSRITEEEERLLHGDPVDRTRYASAQDFVVESTKMLENGKLISIRAHTRFADFPRHTHNYIEIMYMCSGSTTHIVNDDVTVTLCAGELLMLNQHACHAIKCAGKEDIAVNFVILPQFFDVALDMVGAENPLGAFLIGGLRKDKGEISFLHFQVADLLPVQNLVENMVWSIHNRQPNHRKINQITMGLLFLQLLNHTDRLASLSGVQHNDALVVDALREIEENYRFARLSPVANRHGVSLSYLSRLIKESTGKTYKELLRQKRLSKAAALLSATRLSVGEVIEAVGYDNTSYFYRVFKEQYGVNPTEYRDRQSS